MILFTAASLENADFEFVVDASWIQASPERCSFTVDLQPRKPATSPRRGRQTRRLARSLPAWDSLRLGPPSFSSSASFCLAVFVPAWSQGLSFQSHTQGCRLFLNLPWRIAFFDSLGASQQRAHGHGHMSVGTLRSSTRPGAIRQPLGATVHHHGAGTCSWAFILSKR